MGLYSFLKRVLLILLLHHPFGKLHKSKPAHVWYEDYFELKTIEAQKSQEEPLTFPLTAYENLDRESGPEGSYHHG